MFRWEFFHLLLRMYLKLHIKSQLENAQVNRKKSSLSVWFPHWMLLKIYPPGINPRNPETWSGLLMEDKLPVGYSTQMCPIRAGEFHGCYHIWHTPESSTTVLELLLNLESWFFYWKCGSQMVISIFTHASIASGVRGHFC